jgi:hypothetical protein
MAYLAGKVPAPLFLAEGLSPVFAILCCGVKRRFKRLAYCGREIAVIELKLLTDWKLSVADDCDLKDLPGRT